jgi:uncharacterized protein DUF2087
MVKMGHNADGLLAHPPEQLRAFLSGGRITAWPARRTQRLLLLDQVAQAFEPGRKYPEAAVDEILKKLYCPVRAFARPGTRRGTLRPNQPPEAGQPCWPAPAPGSGVPV